MKIVVKQLFLLVYLKIGAGSNHKVRLRLRIQQQQQKTRLQEAPAPQHCFITSKKFFFITIVKRLKVERQTAMAAVLPDQI